MREFAHARIAKTILRLFLHFAILRRQRNQPINLSFAMNPTQSMHESEQLELGRVIANESQIFVPLFR
jgi:hypothetical protein